jgi:hypothetical protein
VYFIEHARFLVAYVELSLVDATQLYLPRHLNGDGPFKQYQGPNAERENQMAQKKASSKKGSGRKRSSSGASNEVREEMRSLKKGRRKNPKQAIAIGLSKARRKGKDVPPPKAGKTSAATRKRAQQDTAVGQAKKTSSRKTAAKKSTTKTSTTKKSAAKRSAAKKAASKKRTSRKRSS